MDSGAASTNNPLGIIQIPGWETIRHLGTKLPTWIFRGHEQEVWQLSTSIERAGAAHACPAHFLQERETRVLNQFRRRASHYLQSPPPEDAAIEWLSLIQHYGGPTRLLDFTRSFYVAAFFAVECAPRDAAIWCVNFNRILDTTPDVEPEGRLDLRIEQSTALANNYLGQRKPEKHAAYVEPYRLHERAAIQQGCFLFPCEVGASFEENLFRGLGHDFPPKGTDINSRAVIEMEDFEFNHFDVIKIIVPRQFHWGMLQDLKRMNITSATLFPTLDGFARSLRYEMRSFEMLQTIVAEMRAKDAYKSIQNPTAKT